MKNTPTHTLKAAIQQLSPQQSLASLLGAFYGRNPHAAGILLPRRGHRPPKARASPPHAAGIS